MIVIIPREMLFLYWFCEGLPVCNDFILRKLFIISKYKPIFTPNVERHLIKWLSHLKLYVILVFYRFHYDIICVSSFAAR